MLPPCSFVVLFAFLSPRLGTLAPPRPAAQASASAARSSRLNETRAAELLDAAFVPAVMGLASGDVTELQLFCAAANCAREEAMPIDRLCALMDALPRPTACRPLNADEAKLRRLWIGLAYLTGEALADLAGESAAAAAVAAVPAELRSEYTGLVGSTLDAKRRGTPLSALPSELPELQGESVLTLSLRVVHVTDDVLEQVRLAGQRADGPSDGEPQ